MDSLIDYLNGRNERRLEQMRHEAYERISAGLRHRRSFRYRAVQRLKYWWSRCRNGL